MRRLSSALAVLAILCVVSSASADVISYPAGGWLPHGAKFSWQHPDQGRDFVTGWRGIIQAPARGCVVAVWSDRAFPWGFGPYYPLVRIDAGPFAGHIWYLGHTSTLLPAGRCFGFGTALSRADQGMPSQIGVFVAGDGGWVEFGEDVNGRLGPNSNTGHWFDGLLLQTLEVGVPDPYRIYPRTKFGLADNQTGSEYNTVKAWDSRGCENPVQRPTCKTTLFHLKLERDRDIWVAHHRFTLVKGHWVWVLLSHARYEEDYLGRRIQGFQHRITAPAGQRCTVAKCG